MGRHPACLRAVEAYTPPAMRPVGLSPAQLTAILRPWGQYRQPAYQRLTRQLELEEGAALLVIGCGEGHAVQWLTTRVAASLEGVDADAAAVAAAVARARSEEVRPRATYQVAPVSDLPYEAAVFDAVIIDLVALGADAAQAAVTEAARVTKDRAQLFCLAPVWIGEPSPRQRARVGELDLRPRYVMEWKQVLREAGLVELTVEELAADWLETSFILTLVRGWKTARWRGARLAFTGAYRALRGAVLKKSLQLSLMWGTRWSSSE